MAGGRERRNAGCKLCFTVHEVERIRSEVFSVGLVNTVSSFRKTERAVRKILSKVPADVVAVQVGEKYIGDRIEAYSVHLKVGYQFAGRGISEHLAVWAVPGIGEDALIAGRKDERAQVVAEKLAFEILGETVVKRFPGFDWRIEALVERSTRRC